MLLKHIREIHKHSRGTYGWPRVHVELVLGTGIGVNHKRLRRLMRQAGLQGLYRRRLRGCTIRNPADQPANDLVNRQFTVAEPEIVVDQDGHVSPYQRTVFEVPVLAARRGEEDQVHGRRS